MRARTRAQGPTRTFFLILFPYGTFITFCIETPQPMKVFTTYIYILALTPSNNWMGLCGSHALVDPIARRGLAVCSVTNSVTNSATSSVTNSVTTSVAISGGRERAWNVRSPEIEPWCSLEALWKLDRTLWSVWRHEMKPWRPRRPQMEPWSV